MGFVVTQYSSIRAVAIVAEGLSFVRLLNLPVLALSISQELVERVQELPLRFVDVNEMTNVLRVTELWSILFGVSGETHA